MKKIIFALILPLPAVAAFKSTTKVVPLQVGQEIAFPQL